MTLASGLMPDELREPTAGEPVLSDRRAFLLNWGKWSKALMAGFILGGSLLGIGQEATAETDRTHSGGGWVNPDQTVIPHGGGWVTPSQGWVTPSQGWVTPNQNWGAPNQGWDHPDQRRDHPDQGWDHPDQRRDHPDQGWDHRGRGSGVNR
jgi:hypothetical protein